jgi:GT2 family glycosyltransferase
VGGDCRHRLLAVVPAYNAVATIGDCLRAIFASSRTPDAVIVFDDGATDGTGDLARSLGAHVLRNDGAPLGPGAGRNAAVRAYEADLVVFVDADVVVHADAIERLESALLASDEVAAAFGSYDDAPRSQRLPALYANLRHHYVHQHGEREAETFWAGLGIVRRSVFLAAGGFDPRYTRPSIEDIEFGVRLKRLRLGRIRLVPEALGTHCKDWGLWQLWTTDVLRRAAPWTKLLVRGDAGAATLNLAWTERLSALIALVGLLSLAGALIWAQALAVTLACASLYLWLNRGFFRLLASRGSGLAVGGSLLHAAYHLYAAATFVLVQLWVRTKIISAQPHAQGENWQDPDHPCLVTVRDG